MGKVIIQEQTIKNPITFIGQQAGICYGTDTSNDTKNFKRGYECIKSQHGRVLEFPDVYMILEDYSARVIREWYTHIGGAPTRLQESTRYINYQEGFEYVIPHSIQNNEAALGEYEAAMDTIQNTLYSLHTNHNIPKEDSAMLLPLGMETTIVCKHNARNLIDMSHQRLCTRAYWEYRELFNDLKKALSEYSPEWKILVDEFFIPKCDVLKYCPEAHGCGRY